MLNDLENKDKLEKMLSRAVNLQEYCNDVVFTLRSEIEKNIVIENSDQLQAILSQLIGRTIRFNNSFQVIITVHLFTRLLSKVDNDVEWCYKNLI
ncbi:hypothetical protein [Orientia tsutsugamushi]|uniref:hypothetical protein n=1 Tax=Orientia tsutsugamushi TaxID=784 RepID=UPI000D5A4204|nr:ATP-binding protein [Orientia tsutsugamushi]